MQFGSLSRLLGLGRYSAVPQAPLALGSVKGDDRPAGHDGLNDQAYDMPEIQPHRHQLQLSSSAQRNAGAVAAVAAVASDSGPLVASKAPAPVYLEVGGSGSRSHNTPVVADSTRLDEYSPPWEQDGEAKAHVAMAAAKRDIEGGDIDASGHKVDWQILFRKISIRLLPLFFVMVILCYVDRTSLAFAAIQLNASLGFSPSVYGMGSGLFFLGYSLFQIPSNLLLRRFGGPTWLALIITAWGLVACTFAAMRTAGQFYVLRLLLGATEAGAFPGMWFVLTTFYPGDMVTFPFSVVEAGISLSHVVAAPLAAACLSLDGVGGMAGWRWLFLLEGVPTLVLAVVMYRLLPRSPETADFLSPSERRALILRIEQHNRSHKIADSNNSSSAQISGGGGGGGGGGGLKCVSSVAGNLGAGGVVIKRAKARGTLENGGGGINGGDAAAGGGGGCTTPGGAGGGSSSSSSDSSYSGVSSTWAAIQPAITNKYVWCMGAIKFVRDIASFGLIFWAPTIVNTLLQEMHRPAGIAERLGVGPGVVIRAPQVDEGARGESGGDGGVGRALLGAVLTLPAAGHHGSGVEAVLLTALPFALAAAGGMALAHSSQRSGERFLHISMPYIITGGILTLYTRAASQSPWLGFLALSLGVVGVYCGSGPSLSLVSELAAGPGLVVALPLYNSLGTLGGFLGPAIVGWLVQGAYNNAARDTSSTTAVIHGGGFGVSAMVLGSALCLAGFMVLALGATMGRLPAVRDARVAVGGSTSNSAQVDHGGCNGGSRAVMEEEDSENGTVLQRSLDSRGIAFRPKGPV
ncbi:hypothetical protein Vafri_6431 [Volvox africanus]|uniref:Major facilitator superfamily (MFS) profile domain-containing protein n=1 Tax=Volvox africanus TaxID=51714 RepID=A0A8J4AYY1_9CHLO|nr:hypothetical protein Vafri_6431 [Volvox africanus]